MTRSAVVATSLLLSSSLSAQAAPPRALLLGEWFGGSTCTRAAWNASCHDERNAYRFEPTAYPDSVVVRGFKLVNEGYVSMGDLTLGFHPATGEWRGDFSTSRGRSRISYLVTDSTLTGQIVDLDADHVIRRATATRGSSVPLPRD